MVSSFFLCFVLFCFFIFFFDLLVIGRHIVPISTHKKTSEPENFLQSKLKINGNNIITFIGGMTGTVFQPMVSVECGLYYILILTVLFIPMFPILTIYCVIVLCDQIFVFKSYFWDAFPLVHLFASTFYAGSISTCVGWPINDSPGG